MVGFEPTSLRSLLVLIFFVMCSIQLVLGNMGPGSANSFVSLSVISFCVVFKNFIYYVYH